LPIFQPYTSYKVIIIPRVFGLNKNGPKSEILVTTLEDVPKSAVENLNFHNESSTSVYLTWKTPTIPNGIITKYEIVIQPSDKRRIVRGKKI